MDTHSISEARTNLYKLVDEVARTSRPICLIGKRSRVVMLAQEDFESMQETLFLLSIPGMNESIREARSEPIANSSTELNW